MKQGDKVKVLRVYNNHSVEKQEMVGKNYEIKRKISKNLFLVWNKDKTDAWIFLKEDLEKVKKTRRVKNDM